MGGTKEIDGRQGRFVRRIINVAIVAISCLMAAGCYTYQDRQLSYLEGKFDQLHLKYSSPLRQKKRYLAHNQIIMNPNRWWAKMNKLQERVDFLQESQKSAEDQLRRELGANANDVIVELREKLAQAASKEDIRRIIAEEFKKRDLKPQSNDGGRDKDTPTGGGGGPSDGKDLTGTDEANRAEDTSRDDSISAMKQIIQEAKRESEGSDVLGHSVIVRKVKRAPTPQQARQRLEWWKRWKRLVKLSRRLDELGRDSEEKIKQQIDELKKTMKKVSPGDPIPDNIKKEIDLLNQKDRDLKDLYSTRDKYVATFQKMGRSRDLMRRVEDIADKIRDAKSMRELKKAAKGIEKLRNWIGGEISEIKKIAQEAESEGPDVSGHSEIIPWIKHASTPQEARQRLEWWKRFVKQWRRLVRLSESGDEETKREAEKLKKKMRQTRPGESNLGDTKKEIDLLDEKADYLDDLYAVRDKYMDTFQKMGRSKDLNRRVGDIVDKIREAGTMSRLNKAAKGIKKLRNWIDGEMKNIQDHVGPDDVTEMEMWDPDKVTVVEEPQEVAVREVGEYKIDLTRYGIKQPQALIGETRAKIFLADPGSGTIQPAIVKGSTVDREHDFKIEMVGPDNKWSKNEKVFRMRVTGADKNSSIDVKRWLALPGKGGKAIKGQILGRTEGRLFLPPGAYYLLATGQTDWGNSFGVIYQVEVPEPPVARDED